MVGLKKDNISRRSEKDMTIKEVTKSMTQDKIEWWKRIHVVDSH